LEVEEKKYGLADKFAVDPAFRGPDATRCHERKTHRYKVHDDIKIEQKGKTDDEPYDLDTF
jgi:hypothetical protein